jgi:proliferating cell nuclear antigen PCNA
MKIIIKEEKKKDIFLAIIQQIKNGTSFANFYFTKELLHIQGMDKSNVCLYNILLRAQWFNEYMVPEESKHICLNMATLYTVLNMCAKGQDLHLYNNVDNGDNINVDLMTTQEKQSNYYFKVPLMDDNQDYEILTIPEREYDVKMTIASKFFCDAVAKISQFGDNIELNFDDEKLILHVEGNEGSMKIEMNEKNFETYETFEGQTTHVQFALSYLQKICLTTKLSENIEFSVSKEFPMQIVYLLEDGSTAAFYIASKIIE